VDAAADWGAACTIGACDGDTLVLHMSPQAPWLVNLPVLLWWQVICG
jgi:hypothetical protein